jgi:serine/threonine-protein kinase HipA
MADERYVWIWLPGQRDPSLCGHLRWDGRAASFAYVRSYRSRPDAMAIAPGWGLDTELGDRLFPSEDDPLPGVIADVAPGRWGDYVLEKISGRRLTPFEALLAGHHDRTGALEFGERPDVAPEHIVSNVSLDQLAEAVSLLDRGMPVDAHAGLIFRHGPSLGGRRPKATIQRDGRSWVAKFVSVRDFDDMQPRREAFGLALARAAGIVVPDFQIVETQGKPVLLVERFDRQGDGGRRHLLSARSLLNLSERQLLSHASYPAVAGILRKLADSDETAAQWFDRMVFNIVLGNTDDHALNHLFGWNGRELSLMPAFDLEQQPDTGAWRSQEMVVGLEGKRSSFRNALSAAAEFGLRPSAARERIRQLVERCQEHCTGLLDRCGIDGAAAADMRRTLLLDLSALE